MSDGFSRVIWVRAINHGTPMIEVKLSRTARYHYLTPDEAQALIDEIRRALAKLNGSGGELLALSASPALFTRGIPPAIRSGPGAPKPASEVR